LAGRSLMQIYPNLDYHLFITADLEERVRRKCIQYNEIDIKNEIRENIIKRDKLQEELYQIIWEQIKELNKSFPRRGRLLQIKP
jgi:cytidylate kinase